MGILYLRRDGEDTGHPAVRSDAQPEQDSQQNTEPAVVNPLLIAIIVIGFLIVATLAAFMAMHCIKSRQKRRRETQRAKHWSESYLAEDQERRMMIHKSIASRSSLVMTAATTTTTENAPIVVTRVQPSPVAPENNNGISSGGHSPADSLGAEGPTGETTSLRDDYKAWEARIQTERRISTTGGVGLDQHPAFATYLSAPQRTCISPLRRVAGDTHYSTHYLGIPELGVNTSHWSRGSEAQGGLVWGLNSPTQHSRPPVSP